MSMAGRFWLGRAWVLGGMLLLSGIACAQSAGDMQPAQPPDRPGETVEQHGRRLLDEMVKALGGEAWLNRGTMYSEGQTAAFFRGQPTGSVVRFNEYKRFSTGTTPDLERVEYLTIRGMIMPGMKRDVAHVWTADNGFEVTFKGRSELPKPQVGDYLRRREHTIEEVMRVWVKEPGVSIVSEGTGMRDRTPIDKVTILTASNDAVTLELAQDTHFPVERSFEWRNQQFKDLDIDEEVYGDWRLIQGIGTAMNMTRYHDGDMVDQTFYTKVRYGDPFGPELFNPDAPFVKK